MVVVVGGGGSGNMQACAAAMHHTRKAYIPALTFPNPLKLVQKVTREMTERVSGPSQHC